MIAAIVVLYYPAQPMIERLLSSLMEQVDGVFLIDNTPGSASGEPPFLEGFGKPVSYVALGENRGIAEAQNIGIKLSIEGGYSYVLLLDQDSALVQGTVSKMLAAEKGLLESGARIAAICPRIFDRRSGARPAAVRYTFGLVRKISGDGLGNQPIATENFIASGSLLRVDALKKIGLMREDLFIEHVDTEWAFRAQSMGYQSYCAANAILEHDFGDDTLRILGKDIYLYSVLRYQYKLRNEAYLLRVKTMGWGWRLYASTRIFYHLMLYTMTSRNQRGAFVSLLRAIGNGLRGRLGKINTSNE